MKQSLVVMLALCAVAPSGVWAQNVLKGQTGKASQFITTHFSGSGTCASCHNGLVDGSGTDVSLEKSWSQSVMRFAFVDPVWRAKVSTEMSRAPHLQGLIEDKCSRCHAPMAHVEATFADTKRSVFGTGFLDLSNPYHYAAMEGISCTLCHQVQDSAYLGTDKANSGKITIGDLYPPGRPLYMRYGDVWTSSMQRSVGYTPMYADHISHSKHCAVCHDLKTPYVDATGAIFSTSETEFPEQMPYREWSLSSYAVAGQGARSCQGCHMPATDGVALSHAPAWLPKRDGFSKHQFRTANSMLLTMIDSHENELGLAPLNLAQALKDGEQFAKTAATLQVVDSSLSGATLAFTVKISNQTGHKLSTGIPIRRIIVHVTVTDPLGRIVFESGRVNPDQGVQACDADSNPLSFEPHYDLITSPDQVQIYEGVMANTDNDVTYTLLRASHFLKDNRLLPAGFDKIMAPQDVAPTADAMNDDNFVGGSDQVSYRIEGLAPVSSRYSVNVQLLEQKVTQAFMQDLLKDDGAVVAAYRNMLERVPRMSKPLAETSVSIYN